MGLESITRGPVLISVSTKVCEPASKPILKGQFLTDQANSCDIFKSEQHQTEAILMAFKLARVNRWLLYKM